MKRFILTYLVFGILIFLSACELAGIYSEITQAELINQTGENVYYAIYDAETASLIDILPFTDPEKLSLPMLPVNKSAKVDLSEIEKLDQGIYIILYLILENHPESSGPIAAGGHYGYVSYEELKRNHGRIILRNRWEINSLQFCDLLYTSTFNYSNLYPIL